MPEKNVPKRSARDRIMHAAIDIMREKGEVEEVTIRGIARQAGVGIGLINYHFQSKERLISEAVRFFLAREISSGWEGQLLFRPKNPIVLIQDMLKSYADFLVDFPHISRISVLNDLNNPGEEDNTMHAVKSLHPYILEALGRNGKDGKAFRVSWIMVAAVQTIFMRSRLFTGDGGIDFSEKNGRDDIIDDLVKTYIRS